ncbi:MAG: carboxyltransferase domain-containing protein, partial [Sphingobacteriaceae bacterium]
MDIADQHFAIYYLSEQAVTIEFGQQIGEEVFNRIRQFNQLIHQNPFPGFLSTVPAYTTLSVYFDPLQIIKSNLPGQDCFEKVCAHLNHLKNKPADQEKSMIKTVSVPVCYGGSFGPDLAELATLHQLAADEIVAMH